MTNKTRKYTKHNAKKKQSKRKHTKRNFRKKQSKRTSMKKKKRGGAPPPEYFAHVQREHDKQATAAQLKRLEEQTESASQEEKAKLQEEMAKLQQDRAAMMNEEQLINAQIAAAEDEWRKYDRTKDYWQIKNLKIAQQELPKTLDEWRIRKDKALQKEQEEKDKLFNDYKEYKRGKMKRNNQRGVEVREKYLKEKKDGNMNVIN